MKNYVTSFLGLGSNVGDKVGNLNKAIEELKSCENILVDSTSGFYKTEPRLFLEQEDFINAVVKIKTSFKVYELHNYLLNIESKIGRTKTFTNGPRIIDIDILLFGSEILNTGTLTIPHSKIAERKFVLIPFAEIDSSVIVPGINKTISVLIDDCKDEGKIEKLVEKNILE